MTLPASLRHFLGRIAGRSSTPTSTSDSGFAIHDLPAVNALFERHGAKPLTLDPEHAAIDAAAAARFLLGSLAASPGLRSRFPGALSGGATGDFANWLAGPGAAELRLGPQAVANVQTAFAEYPGDRAWRIYEFRPDMRTVFPFGLTPQQRGELLDWLLSYGRAEMDITPEAAVWSFFQRDELPDRGLAKSFSLNPAWQARVPHGLTRFGWDELLRVLKMEFGLAGSWADRLQPPERFSAGEASHPGINILAHFRFPCGLQEEAVQIAQGLQAAGWNVERRGLLGNYPHFAEDPAEYDAPELHPISFIKLGAGEPLDLAYHRAGLYPRPGVYRIVGWSWELEDFPRESVERAGLANEVWTPSEFCANAVRKVLTDRPVFAMPPAIAAPRPVKVSRSAFGLRDDAYLFLFVFDMASGFERKNSLGVIRAFRRAFAKEECVQLAIKVSRAAVNRAAHEQLTAAATAAHVTVIDRFLPRAELAGLVDASDCYVSLHRSEGFGLTLVEAMLLGKPVIATDYSASSEYLDASKGLPVRFTMTSVGPGNDPYPAASHWAEPDEHHAAEQMRWVFENREAARALGEAARRRLADWLSPERATRRMTQRLEAIQKQLTAAASPAGSPSRLP